MVRDLDRLRLASDDQVLYFTGSMMIEVVPFYHSIAAIILGTVADDRAVIATTMVAFALASTLTGIAFYALGALKLGSLSEFFPRHILVGCIGGVGAFLFVTGCVFHLFLPLGMSC